jgi:predicted nucleic acid-binding protein
MSNKVLVDTNIFVYTRDRSEPEKQEKAQEILNKLVELETGVISTQVLAEFFTKVTSPRFSSPIEITEAYIELEALIGNWEVKEVTSLVVLEAARGVRDYQFSYWDAQLWAVAKLNQIPLIYSEDFNVGAEIELVRFVNPLTD